jgi:hypothetical protein
MLLFNLLHPNIPILTLRIIGVVAIVVMIVALAVRELNDKLGNNANVAVYIALILGGLVLTYVVLITQGSIH